MSGIKETFDLISEATSTMAEGDSDRPCTLTGAPLLLAAAVYCVIKISTWIGDNAYSRQQKRSSRLSPLREAKKSHPDVLLEAETDAEKAKVNRYSVWCRWRQEKAQKYRNELTENKTSRRRDSFSFTPFSLLLLLILWATPFLLKCSGLFPPEDDSALSNIKEENLPSMVPPLALLVLLTIRIPVYIVACCLYRATREANNPISIWGFSWMSASILFSAMIAVSIETATKCTAKLLTRELMLAATVALFVPLSFAAGYVIDYIIDRWGFANHPNLEDHYHNSLSSRRNRYVLAIFNFVFRLRLSILFEVLYFESTINNIYVLVVFAVTLSPAALLSIVVSLLCIISFICEDEFALYGHHVILHNGQKRKDKIIGYGLSAKSTYYQPLSRRRELIFEGWNTQGDDHGVSIRNVDDFDAMAPKGKCGETKLCAQWKSATR